MAKIAGPMSISASRTFDTDCLLLEIKLPNGHLLDCKTSCAVLGGAVEYIMKQLEHPDE